MAVRWCSLKEDALCRLGCIPELFDTERRGAARYLYQRRTQKSPREVVQQPLVTTLRSECACEPKVLGSRHRSKLQLSLTVRQLSHRPKVGLLTDHESPQRTEALTHCRSTPPGLPLWENGYHTTADHRYPNELTHAYCAKFVNSPRDQTALLAPSTPPEHCAAP